MFTLVKGMEDGPRSTHIHIFFKLEQLTSVSSSFYPHSPFLVTLSPKRNLESKELKLNYSSFIVLFPNNVFHSFVLILPKFSEELGQYIANASDSVAK